MCMKPVCEVLEMLPWNCLGAFVMLLLLSCGNVCANSDSGVVVVERSYTMTIGEKPGSLANLNTTVVEAQFGQNYTRSVDLNTQFLFVYTYNETNYTTAVRVSVSSKSVTSDFPLMIVVRQQEGILSWAVPLNIDYLYSYRDVSRTLCPVNKKHRQEMASRQIIYVEASSMSRNLTEFSFSAHHIEDFELRHEEPRNVTVSPSKPQYFMYTFPKGVTSVQLKVTSSESICMTVSVQDIRCPVFDLDRNVEFAGKHQTMSLQAAMFLEVKDYTNGSFYVVLIVKPRDLDCAGIEQITSSTGLQREKLVTVLVKTTLSSAQYYKAIFAALGVLLAFYIVAAFIGVVYHGCGLNKGLLDLSDAERDEESTHPFLQAQVNRNYGTTNSSGAVKELMDVKSRDSASASAGASAEADVNASVNQDSVMISRGDSVDLSDVDCLKDADQEKEVFRTKTALFVTDLARKSSKKLAKTYKIYHWNLFTIAIFYGLPVAQLVITYQKVLSETGDEDICYYNFDCAHPLGVVSSFNNIFSNIGYILLGILFIILVWRRDVLNKRVLSDHSETEQQFGIPQHFGLFYAMGLALMMEGIMSGCYHVCPNYSNFQFDTSFMYIIACLCMLKIYQKRHPDINAKAHQAYLCMALIIFLAVMGVVYAGSIFWILYAVVHMLVTLLLSAQIYYMGRWKIDRYIFKRILYLLISDGLKCARPSYRDRFILLLIGNAINWSFALYGAIEQPPDFASYLLAIFIGNLLLYCLFYIIMKLLSRERIHALAVMCIIFASITWAAALYFFFWHLTSWQKTPAGSREGNRDCILLEFYDSHDVWHLLSAISLFFSFLILLTLDDDLVFKRRDRIPVF